MWLLKISNVNVIQCQWLASGWAAGTAAGGGCGWCTNMPVALANQLCNQ